MLTVAERATLPAAGIIAVLPLKPPRLVICRPASGPEALLKVVVWGAMLSY